MWSLYKLQFKTNIKSPAMMMPLFFPLIIMILYSISINDSQDLAIAFGSLLGLIVLQSGMFGFGFNFIEIKNSVLLRRISATKITKWEVLMSIMLWGLTVMFLTIIWIFILLEIFSIVGFFGVDTNGTKIVMPWGEVSWGGIIVALIGGIIVTFPLGFLFANLSKDINSFETKVFLYFFIAAFLSGLLIPYAAIPWFQWAGYFTPNAWNAHMFIDASQGASVLHLGGYTLDGSSVAGWEATLDIFLPIFLGFSFFFVDMKIFKWTD